jgi:uncharacterized Zn finger protein
MDISFHCGSCGQRMVIDERGAGLVIQCPKCGRDVSVPKAVAPKPSPTTKPTILLEEEKKRTDALKWAPPSGRTPGWSKK